MYMNEQTMAHGAAVPRGFLTARPSVFVSSPRDLSKGEETEEAKRRGERTKKKRSKIKKKRAF